MVVNIPIILSNLTLKTVFLQTLDQVNIYYKYKFYLLDPAELPNCKSDLIIVDLETYESLQDNFLKNKKLFFINTLNSTIQKKISKNESSIFSAPFRIYDLFNSVNNYLEQINKRDKKKLTFSTHTYDPYTRELYSEISSLRFTEKESEIFICLIHSDDKYLSKEYLLEEIWKYNQKIDTHTLETHLYSLRKKIENILGISSLIKYEESKGYTIDKSLL